MRVLLISGSYPPMRCGVGDYTHRLATALAGIEGNDVAVLTSEAARLHADMPLPVRVFPAIKRWGAGDLVAAVRILREWRPDVVHVQYPTQGYGSGALPLWLPLVAWVLGARVVQTWHEPYGLLQTPQLLLKLAVPGRVVVVRHGYIDLLPRWLRPLVRLARPQFITNASAIPRARLTVEQRVTLRARYLRGQSRLLVFFGFLYRHKGVDLLFDVADPAVDQIIIAGDTDHLDYKRELETRVDSTPWAGKATFTGFLSADDAAALLSVADAVVLPFRGNGGGEWNTSLHGAIDNDAYVVTTSRSRRGLDAATQVYYTGIDAVEEMREALRRIPTTRRQRPATVDAWSDIAAAHMGIYGPAARERVVGA
jgi:glycosyltransferase involved in cell wall biosynthesis